MIYKLLFILFFISCTENNQKSHAKLLIDNQKETVDTLIIDSLRYYSIIALSKREMEFINQSKIGITNSKDDFDTKEEYLNMFPLETEYFFDTANLILLIVNQHYPVISVKKILLHEKLNSTILDGLTDWIIPIKLGYLKNKGFIEINFDKYNQKYYYSKSSMNFLSPNVIEEKYNDRIYNYDKISLNKVDDLLSKYYLQKLFLDKEVTFEIKIKNNNKRLELDSAIKYCLDNHLHDNILDKNKESLIYTVYFHVGRDGEINDLMLESYSALTYKEVDVKEVEIISECLLNKVKNISFFIPAKFDDSVVNSIFVKTYSPSFGILH